MFFFRRCRALSSYRNSDSVHGRDRRFFSDTKSTYRKTSKQQSRLILKRKNNATEELSVQNGAMAETSYTSRSGQGNSSSGSSQNARDEKQVVCQFESGLWAGYLCCFSPLLRITDIFLIAEKATEQVEEEEPWFGLGSMHPNSH